PVHPGLIQWGNVTPYTATAATPGYEFGLHSFPLLGATSETMAGNVVMQFGVGKPTTLPSAATNVASGSYRSEKGSLSFNAEMDCRSGKQAFETEQGKIPPQKSSGTGTSSSRLPNHTN